MAGNCDLGFGDTMQALESETPILPGNATKRAQGNRRRLERTLKEMLTKPENARPRMTVEVFSWAGALPYRRVIE